MIVSHKLQPIEIFGDNETEEDQTFHVRAFDGITATVKLGEECLFTVASWRETAEAIAKALEMLELEP
jgi:hypothetical protein